MTALLLVPWTAAILCALLLAAIAVQIANDRPPMFLPTSALRPAPRYLEPGPRIGGCDITAAYLPARAS